MDPLEARASYPELNGGEVLGGKYLLLEPLAVGGMGQVWSARNLATGATVAAKVLLPAYAASASGLARFRREARATATLSHRAIVRVFDLIELDEQRGSLVMVMELLRGHTLARHLEQMSQLSVEETVAIVLPLLSAIEHAHALGIVHRDLKPENVFLAVEPDGQMMPKIVDFGISKHVRESPITLEGQTVGTPSYMSPEQTAGGAIDARSDVFAMGLLLYECLSGRNPFVVQATGYAVQNLIPVFDLEPAPLAHVPPALWEVVARSLAKSPGDRFASASDLAKALRAAVSPGVSPSAGTAPELPAVVAPAKALAPRSSRRKTAALAAVSMAIAALAYFGRTRDAIAVAGTPPAEAVAHAKYLTASVDRLDDAAVLARQNARRRSLAYARIVRDPGF